MFTQATLKPADLAVAVRASQEWRMPSSERDKLVAKEYVGSVTIRAVRMPPDGAPVDGVATVEAQTQSEGDQPAVRVRFVTIGTDPVLGTLAPGQVVCVRARLSTFSGTAAAPILSFTGMSIVTRPDFAPPVCESS